MQARKFLSNCSFGRDSEVIAALDSGFDVNTTIRGATGLHFACSHNRASIVQTLLRAEGININFRDRFGRSALDFACMQQNTKIVTILVKIPSIEINAINNRGETALFIAAGRCPASIPILVEHGIDIEVKANNGMSALQSALCVADSSILRQMERGKLSVQALVNFGCNLSETDRQNQHVINSLEINAAQRETCRQAFRGMHWLPSVQKELILDFLYL